MATVTTFTFRDHCDRFQVLLLLLLLVLGAQNALGQITRVGQSSAATAGGGGTSVAVTTPAGTVLNDLMVGVVTVRGAGQTIVLPAGWTAAPGLSSSVGGNMNQQVFYRVATATEPAAHTFSWAVSDRGIASIVPYRNVNITTPVDVTGAQTSASSTNIVAPSITTSVVNTMLVGFFGDAHTGASLTTPAGMTNIFGAGSEPASGSGPNGVRTLVADELFTPNGATGTRTAISSRNVANIGHILALRPYVVLVTPGGFNAYETSTGAGAITGVIKTKISGNLIGLDIIALDPAKTAILTTFVGMVRVEVLDSSDNTGALDANNCRPTWTTIQTLSPDSVFVAGDNGRKTISFTVPDAYRDARLRITYPAGAPTVTGCSTDNFAIRPSAFTGLSASDADWQTAGITRTLNDVTFGTITHKAGQPFSVRASAVNAAGSPAITANYTGAPTATLSACAGAACTATFGTLSLNTTFAAGQLVSDVATYDNVGAFQLQLVDSSFAGVDAGDTAGDCTAAGRYVCSASIAVGRFVPDHFAVSYNTPEFGTACSGGGFGYVGQTFSYTTAPVITLRAENVANNPTTFYTDNTKWWRLTNASLTGKSYTAASGTLDVSGITGTDPVINDAGSGSGTLTFGSGTGLFFTRTTPVVPFDAELSLAIDVIDADGVTYAGNPARFGTATAGNGIAFSDGNALTMNDKQMRFGRLRIGNANGSQLLPLKVQMQAQYWASTGAGNSFIANTDDSCTALVAANIALGNYQKNLNACETSVTVGSFAGGRSAVQLSAPGNGNNGSVDLTANLGAGGSGTTCVAGAVTPVTGANRAYLQGNWSGGAYDQNPTARAAFGVYRGAEEVIHIRENY